LTTGSSRNSWSEGWKLLIGLFVRRSAPVAFFGGLHLHECLDLALEKIQRSQKGYLVTQSRVKQRRSKKLESWFLVLEAGGYAAQLGLYLFKVKNQLKKIPGKSVVYQ
jgi:hypothetical protein